MDSLKERINKAASKIWRGLAKAPLYVQVAVALCAIGFLTGNGEVACFLLVAGVCWLLWKHGD